MSSYYTKEGPEWTANGPYDQPSPNGKANYLLPQFYQTSHVTSIKEHYKILVRILKLVEPSAYFLVRLARAEFLLENLVGARENWLKAQRIVGIGKDEAFDKGLGEFIAWNDEDRKLEDEEWNDKSNVGVSWSPLKTLEGYSVAPSNESKVDSIKERWNELKSRNNLASERYLRYAHIQTCEVERVFKLAGESESRLVRTGFHVAAFDKLESTPPLMTDRDEIILVLEDCEKAMNLIEEVVKSASNESISNITIATIHKLHSITLENCYFHKGEDEEGNSFAYVVPRGEFRQTLSFTSLEENNAISGKTVDDLKFENLGLKDELVEREDVDAEEDEKEPLIVQYAPWQSIEKEMELFVENLNILLRRNDVDPVAAASWIHTAFVSIHPYLDGNGRVTRLLASIPLIKAGLPPMLIISDIQRAAYFEACSYAQQDHDVTRLQAIISEGIQLGMDFVEVFPPL